MHLSDSILSISVFSGNLTHDLGIALKVELVPVPQTVPAKVMGLFNSQGMHELIKSLD